jgi:hypothetical protein
MIAIMTLAICAAGYGAKKRLGDSVYIRLDASINNCNVELFPATFATTGAYLASTFASLVPGPCPVKHAIYVGD